MLQRKISPSNYKGPTRTEDDFLQGLTIKMRFFKKIPNGTAEDMERKFSPDDQVQIKISQLELNNVRLFTDSSPVGILLFSLCSLKLFSCNYRG